jgi:uncharacterized membrane protein
MILRAIAGVVTGAILWWAFFFAIGTGTGLLWPAYREAARLMFAAGDFSGFTTPMLFLNLVLFLAIGVAAGWIAALIGRHRFTAPVVALLYLLYTGFNHYFLVWDKLPDWYNVIVPFVIAGSIVLGGRLRMQAKDPASAGPGH